MDKDETRVSSMLLYLMVGVVLVGGTWAALVPVEDVVPSPGVVRPLGEAIAVSVPQAGTVTALHRKTSAEVVAGDVLLTVSTSFMEDEYVLFAPVSGTVFWQRQLLAGDRVEVGERVAVVYEHGPIGLEVAISQQDLRLVEPGLPARIRVDAYPYEQFGTLQGRVLEVSLSPDVGTGIRATALIEVIAGDAEMRLLPGMTARVDIIKGVSTLLRQLF